uniref:Si:dkey-246g23.2 n=1 Tax=Nothobranchius furzeri TaxID=105023 RepID=A0A8C6Q1G3_NOTFU
MDREVVLEEEDMEGSWTLLSLFASLLMTFGGALPYVPQFQEIRRRSSSEGFSTRVCLVLLIANILRIFFWIGKQFELTLLLQSVVMILTMFIMLHLCCSVQSTNQVSTKQHRLTDLNWNYFWKWSAFEDYLLFCFGLTVLCAVLTLLLLDSVVFVETLGSLAVMFEAMLGIPQLLQNFHHRSTKGMRKDENRNDADLEDLLRPCHHQGSSGHPPPPPASCIHTAADQFHCPSRPHTCQVSFVSVFVAGSSLSLAVATHPRSQSCNQMRA